MRPTKPLIITILLAVVVSLSFPTVRADRVGEMLRFPTKEVSQEKLNLWHRTNTERSQSGTLPSDTILSLTKSGDNLFIGLQNGLTRYNVKTKTFKTFTLLDGLGENLSAVMATDNNGKVWVGGTNTLIEASENAVTNHSKTTVFEDLITYSMFERNNGELWMATNKGLYQRTLDGRWIVKSKGIPNGLTGVAIDGNGNIWGYSNALLFFDLKNLGWENMLVDNWDTYLPLDSNRITINALEVSSSNELLIGTDRGLFIHDIDANLWTHDTTVTGLISNIEVVPSGDLWVGGNEGLWKRHNTIWLKYTRENGIPETRITALQSDGQTVWVGTQKGLYLIDGSAVEVITSSGRSRKVYGYNQEQLALIKASESVQVIQSNKAEQGRQNAINDVLGNTFADLQQPGREWVRDGVITLNTLSKTKFGNPLFQEVENFFPEERILKEQLVKIALLGAGQTMVGQPTDFTIHADVPANDWSVPYINKAVEMGALPRSRAFGFNNPVSRYEALELIFAIFKIPVDSVSVTEFVDLNPNQISLVETAVKKGFVKGFTINNAITVKVGDKYPIVNQLLTTGSGGINVTRLQQALAELGFYKSQSTGVYDTDTTNAVADYQVNRGLLSAGDEGWGAFGTATRSKLAGEQLFTGSAEGTSKLFKPSDVLNRAQMAIILLKVMESR